MENKRKKRGRKAARPKRRPVDKCNLSEKCAIEICQKVYEENINDIYSRDSKEVVSATSATDNFTLDELRDKYSKF